MDAFASFERGRRGGLGLEMCTKMTGWIVELLKMGILVKVDYDSILGPSITLPIMLYRFLWEWMRGEKGVEGR